MSNLKRPDLASHYGDVLNSLKRGRLIPFLGPQGLPDRPLQSLVGGVADLCGTRRSLPPHLPGPYRR